MLIRATSWLVLATTLTASPALAVERPVSNAAELRAAFGAATEGDVIRLAPGIYSFTNALFTSNDGSASQPILVTTGQLGDARLDFSAIEGVVINNAYWVLEKVWINGACPTPEDCESGLGVKPGARGFILRGSRLSNWTELVKGARTASAEVQDVTLFGNELYNDAPRSTGGTAIDIVGGQRWRVIGNYVHDWGGGSSADYGIFSKGSTSDGIIERNLVICGHDRAPASASVGISAGGGGTGAQYCPGGTTCVCEDRGTIFRNNIVAHCGDVGLHSRRGCGSKFLNNTVFDVAGGLQIQVESPEAAVEVRNNVVAGHVFGGTNFVASNNLFDVSGADFLRLYRDPANADFSAGTDPSASRDQGAPLVEVPDDYCGTARSTTDIGAIEFPAASPTWPWAPPGGSIPPPTDAGVPPNDAGFAPADTGTGPADSELPPPPDAGVSDPDSGATPRDSGATPRDSGATPRDSGATPRDGGATPVDSGVPLADTGVTGRDGGDASASQDVGVAPGTDGGVMPRDASQPGGSNQGIRGGCGCAVARPERGTLGNWVSVWLALAGGLRLRPGRRSRF